MILYHNKNGRHTIMTQPIAVESLIISVVSGIFQESLEIRTDQGPNEYRGSGNRSFCFTTLVEAIGYTY